jgi:hypothetical protein
MEATLTVVWELAGVDAENGTIVQSSPQKHAQTPPRFAPEERETSQSGATIRTMSPNTLDAPASDAF